MSHSRKLSLTALVLGLAASTAYASSPSLTLQTQIAQANGLTLPQETLTAQLAAQPLLDAQNQVVTQQALQSQLTLNQFNSLADQAFKSGFKPLAPHRDFDDDDKRPHRDWDKDDKQPRPDFDRDDKRPRSDFDRDDKRSRSDADRDNKKTRPDFDRNDKHPRADADRDGKQPRPDFDRDDKRPRSDVERDGKQPRPDFDRDDKQPHKNFDRDDNQPRSYRNHDRHQPHPERSSWARSLFSNSSAFLNTAGVVSSNGNVDAFANQLTAGYSLNIPRYHTNVTLFADAEIGKTSSTSNNQNLTTKAHTGYGVGAFASFKQHGFTLSGLASYDWGKTSINGTTDYTSLINQLTDATLKDQLATSAKSTTTVEAPTRTTNFLLKGEYSFHVGRGVSLTPNLTYQYQHFAPQEQTTTSSNSTTQAQAATTSAIPALTTHGIGAGVDLSYHINPRVVVGADAQVMKYQTTLAQPQVGANPTENKVTITSVNTKLNYLNYNTNLKASYNITPHVTVSAKVGYSYTTELEQSGVNYGVGISYRF